MPEIADYEFGMDEAQLLTRLQNHFSDGLVIVIGSGLSCAEGLPGMGSLVHDLLREVPTRIASSDEPDWAKLVPLLPAEGLEAALLKVEVSDQLHALIASIVAESVDSKERLVLKDVLQGKRRLRLTKLVPNLLKSETAINVITTNYDVLAEVAFEEAGFAIDTMFSGQFSGRLNERDAKLALLREVKIVRKNARFVWRNHARIAKPHGSLDWFNRGGVPVRSAIRLDVSDALIVAPGRRKFRTGYDSPFDVQRERANRAVDEAKRFLILGYGFNDDHLETHLVPAIERGAPTLILTRGLSGKAEHIARSSANVIAIDRRDLDSRSRVLVGTSSYTFDKNFWDLGSFVEEVFGK